MAGGVGTTTLVEPSQSSVRPAISCAIDGPLGRLAYREFESYCADWRNISASIEPETDRHAWPINQDPNIADLPALDTDVEQLSNTKLCLVAGAFACLAPRGDTGNLVHQTKSIAWLPEHSSSGNMERQTGGWGRLDSEVAREMSRFILSCDAVLILTSAANPPPPPAIEHIVQAFSQAASFPHENIHLSRIVFGIADCGFPFAFDGLQFTLTNVSSSDMYDRAVGPAMDAIDQLYREVRRLKEKSSPAANVKILAAPFDFLGDVSSRNILNRDPAEPNVALLRPRDFPKEQRIFEPGNNWKTFSLADPYIIAATGALSKMCFDLTR